MGGLKAAFRLIGAGWVLVRHDALAPREAEPFLPAPARLAARALRLFAGPEAKRGRPGERLGRAFETLGPAAIKLGQLLSTRADIFGPEFAEDLSHLKDRLAPFPMDQARAEIERSLGRPLDSLFSALEPPVAAASLAQAHPALLADGRKVAVKVLRPGVEARVAADIAAARLAARLADALVPAARRLEPIAFVATVARSMELELDLRLEAAAASELGEVMAKDGYMSAPAVVWDGVGRRVLTLEWATGVPLSLAESLDQPGLDRPTLANNVIRGFLAQAVDHGVFHADLHEGNLFVSAPAQITAVDFGIIGRIGRKEQRFLAEILYGFLRRDYRRIAEVHFEAGYVPAHHSIDDFAQSLRAIGEPIFGKPASEVSMGRLLAQLFENTALFGMHLRPELVLLQKTMATVEGVARRIDPNSDIWTAAKPVVERWIRRELSPPAQAKALIDEGRAVLTGLSRWAQSPPPAPAVIVHKRGLTGPAALILSVIALGVATAALGMMLSVLLL